MVSLLEKLRHGDWEVDPPDFGDVNDGEGELSSL